MIETHLPLHIEPVAVPELQRLRTRLAAAEAEDGECEFVKVEVSRTATTELFFKVPKGFKAEDIYRHYRKVMEAANDVSSFDWDQDRDTDIAGVQICDRAEAERYEHGDFFEEEVKELRAQIRKLEADEVARVKKPLMDTDGH